MSTPRYLLISLFFLLCSKVFSQDLSASFFQQLHAAGDRNKPVTPSLLKEQILYNATTFEKQKSTLPQKKQMLNGTPGKLRPSPVVTGTKTTCFDTSLRLSYRKDTMWLANDFITKTRDGNILIPGFDLNPVTNHSDAHLIKCTQLGDTLWSKSIQGGFPRYFIDVYKAFELADNSILLAGNMSIPMPYNGRSDLMLIRLTAKGDLIWEKTFKTKVWDVDTTSGSIDIRGCQQDNSGNIYLGGDIRTDASSRVSLAVKMDLSGNIIWSNGYTDLAFSYNQELLINGNKLMQFATKVYQNMVDPVVLEMDINSGNTLSITGFHSPVNNIWYSFYANRMVKLNNGNILLYGNGPMEGQNFDTTHLSTNCGWIEITPDLQFVKSAIVKSTKMDTYNSTYPTFFEDGSGVYLRTKSRGSYATDAIYATVKNDQIVKEKIIHYRGQFISWPSNFLHLNDGGYLSTTFFGDSVAPEPYFEFMRLHDSDTSGSCVGSDTATSFVIPQFYYPHHNFNFTGFLTSVLEENQRPFKGIFNNGFSIVSNCKQVSFCDSLRLSVLKDTICTGTPVIISVYKNKECGANPTWYFDSAFIDLQRINDSTVTAIIHKNWQGNISASIDGCKLLQDSVHLTVLQAPGIVDLGPDSVLCPGNTLLLNAKKGYSSYYWQNGSTDSTFSVTAPGKYNVTVRDACGGIFSDTVNIAPHPPIPFFIGADVEICKGQSVFITAPGGFIHYQWSGFNIKNDTLQSIIAIPAASGWYKVTATHSAGCFAVDSALVTVIQTQSVHLGNDTSLCTDMQLQLDAGPGFNNYQWNTGQQQQQITVSQVGSYSVIATLNGCIVRDTLQVLNLYSLPVFNLGRDSMLCQGQTLLLGVNLPQATYRWSSQSTTPSLIVNQPGIYWLQITQQGCSSSDTIAINYTTAPTIHLGNDTSLCQGQSLLLNAASLGASYTWQDGSTASAYNVTSPGNYKVKASIGHCSTADTILINFIPVPLFTLGRDSFVCTGRQLVLSPVLNTTASFLWQDGSTTPTYIVTTAGLYSLRVTSQCGSYADDITITAGLCNIEMPSAFSPNGDGLNETFRVKYPFPVQEFRLAIYNRYGEIIFETTDINKGWDGKSKGEPWFQSSYVWTIYFKGTNNRQQSLKGTVTVIR